jgi:hypothetical protein
MRGVLEWVRTAGNIHPSTRRGAAISLNATFRVPNLHAFGLRTQPAAMEEQLNDRTIRFVGIPAFGILIPNLTGLFGPLGHSDALYWAGTVYFVLLSFCIWQGNRYFLLKQRAHFDWFRHPARKVMVLLAANVLYTAPLTIGWLWVWYLTAAFAAPDVHAIQVVTLMNVICVVFITHIYETVYLIRQREDDMLRVEKLERARAESELEALRSQIDPHFMFNSLNTLAHLIETRTDQARAFCDELADVYRYILRHKNEALVPLADELAFAGSYAALMKRRFGEAIDIRFDDTASHGTASPGTASNRTVQWDAPPVNGRLIPPISIQVLLENAVKHNAFSEANPLCVFIEVGAETVTVLNERRPLGVPGPSSKIGLRNLNERFELLTRQGIGIDARGGHFRVTLPLTKS